MPDPDEFAPAKINLHLHVTGRRQDGYHLLDSLVVFAGVGDRLSVSSSDKLSLSVAGPFAANLQMETDNLVLRAARQLAAWAGRPATGHLILEKNLPVASGIGGGSADAAAALRLLCRFWKLEPAASDLSSIARGLGADVPVCLLSQASLMSGIGERLAPAPPLPPVGLMLVNPGVAVATPAVFQARTGGFSAPAGFADRRWRDSTGLIDDLRGTKNDLEQAACVLAPEIGAALDLLRTVPGCRLARMSGSGATCFGLFDSAQAAREASAAVVQPGWWVWAGGMFTR